MIKMAHRPSWARDANSMSVRGGPGEVERLHAAATARGLKIAEMVHVTVDGSDALYGRGE